MRTGTTRGLIILVTKNIRSFCAILLVMPIRDQFMNNVDFESASGMSTTIVSQKLAHTGDLEGKSEQ